MERKDHSLTGRTNCAGCAAKAGPGVLDRLLECLPIQNDPDLLVGFGTSDDASVYRLSDSQAILQTVDLFPPIVDDPYFFGQIAAANALSDIYAMGGAPKLALNILCVPPDLPPGVPAEILRGGADKAAEAGVLITGGHTTFDSEPKYGLCVTGFAHPNQIWTNAGARPGDLLILTKPLGTGVLAAAYKENLLSSAEYDLWIRAMTALNRAASQRMKNFSIHACTDISGFGLLGHAREMAQGSGVTLRLSSVDVPLLPGAARMAGKGMIPAGVYTNRNHLKSSVSIAKGVPGWMAELMFDPQTSGGLLIAADKETAEALTADLVQKGVPAGIVGRAESLSEHFVQAELSIF